MTWQRIDSPFASAVRAEVRPTPTTAVRGREAPALVTQRAGVDVVIELLDCDPVLAERIFATLRGEVVHWEKQP